jgi:hypothetical protein
MKMIGPSFATVKLEAGRAAGCDAKPEIIRQCHPSGSRSRSEHQNGFRNELHIDLKSGNDGLVYPPTTPKFAT